MINSCDYCGRSLYLNRGDVSCDGCGASLPIDEKRTPQILYNSEMFDAEAVRYLGEPGSYIPLKATWLQMNYEKQKHAVYVDAISSAAVHIGNVLKVI